MSENVIKKYSNGEITIVWQPALCVHSTICWKKDTGLPDVFNPREKPWIKPEAGSTEAMRAQVDKCPSGALSYVVDKEEESPEDILRETIVEVLPAGPLLVYGNVDVKYKDGREKRQTKVTAFCRCGHSANKPYCDGSHIKAGFEG